MKFEDLYERLFEGRKFDSVIRRGIAMATIGGLAIGGDSYGLEVDDKPTSTINKSSNVKTDKKIDPKKILKDLISTMDQNKEIVKLLQIIGEVESHMDPTALGDLKLTNHAYGFLQIRKPAFQDAVDRQVKAYSIDGVVEDLLVDENSIEVEASIKNSIKVFHSYLARFLKNEKELSFDKVVGLWNGGPAGRYDTKSIKLDNYRKKAKIVAIEKNIKVDFQKLKLELSDSNFSIF